MLGQTISHYRILEKLGGGGMGVVYRAEDLKLGRVVALKFLPGDISHDDEAVERFTREARAASALDHPNLCTVHEIGEGDDGRLFIAMACYDGETLKKKIERGPVPIDDALRYATQVAEGLAAAHARGIVHRDIKPANVIVTSDGRVKILDFGLAKLINESRLTASGHTSGTPAYMSPEQIQGDVVDARTDIWSLGNVLFEMVAGQRAFRGESDQAVIHSILHEPREMLATYRTGVTPGLETVIEKSLQKDRGRRYQNALEMIDDLRACLNEENTVTVMRQALRRVTARRALSAAVLVLALAAPIWFMASRHVTPLPSSRTSLVIFPFTIRGNSNVGFLREGLVELLSRKIDGVNEIHVVDPSIKFPHSGADPDLIDGLVFEDPAPIGTPLVDITHAGWLPRAFFDAIAPNGSAGILGVTFTFIFVDGNAEGDVGAPVCLPSPTGTRIPQGAPDPPCLR